MEGISFVTSGSRVYFEKYGRNLVSTFLERVDPSIKLKVYCETSIEGGPPYLTDAEMKGRVSLLELYERTRLADFLAMAEPKVKAKMGEVPHDPDKKLSDPRYKYRWDALTFGKKAFSIIDALHSCETRYLFWVDSDVAFLKRCPKSLFLRLFAGGWDLVYFGRANFHSETGIIGFDLASPRTVDFAARFKDIWESGRILGIERGWTDCDAFDKVLEKMKLEKAIKARNISPPGQHHVIAYSVLSPYLDHMKGPRKIPGASPERAKFLSGGK